MACDGPHNTLALKNVFVKAGRCKDFVFQHCAVVSLDSGVPVCSLLSAYPAKGHNESCHTFKVQFVVQYEKMHGEFSWKNAEELDMGFKRLMGF